MWAEVRLRPVSMIAGAAVALTLFLGQLLGRA